eukprot:1429544-Pyramimonas_sp.AAC.1
MTNNGKPTHVWHVAVGPAAAHPTGRARSSGARSSGLQRPHPPDARKHRAPPRKGERPDTPPRRGRSRGHPRLWGGPREEYPESEMQHLVGRSDAGLA